MGKYTQLASSVVLKGVIFIKPGYDSSGKQHKVGIYMYKRAKIETKHVL